ncbi:hypothetical protein LTR86_011130 [Recurvomyces mirabilis]|nr:hypothetical protein LTR86_011130 [Recurvomyces mirabilis]
MAFPPSWTRLDAEPNAGARGLSEELGLRGKLVVVLDQGTPIACAGVEPFRGEDWINDVTGLEPPSNDKPATSDPELHTRSPQAGGDLVQDWEICCFCVHPDYRGQGISRTLINNALKIIKPLGAKRLIANYSSEETGSMWPHLGFDTPIGRGSLLKKGFVPPGRSQEVEGLREDLHFRMGAVIL